jgi:uncharacterized protein involved in high-affinity Fe2+ transport
MVRCLLPVQRLCPKRASKPYDFSSFRFAGVALVAGPRRARARVPIGKPQIRQRHGDRAVYLQAVTMEPAGMMREPKASDIHLEADIKATDKNSQRLRRTAP